jgi:hypothetical protein
MPFGTLRIHKTLGIIGMKNYLDIDEQIDQNKAVLDFYYSNYQRTQSKISILVLIYSVIAIYILQVVKYPFETFTDSNWTIIIFYTLFLIGFLALLLISIRNTYLLLKPIDVAYLHYPKYYYTDIKTQYQNSLQTDDEETLNDYIKATYLNELEEVVKHNSYLFKIKSKYYDFAFKSGLASVLIYLLCTGFVIFKDEKPKDFNLKNYKEIITEIDSLNTVNHKSIIMSDKKETPKQDSGKVKVDPKKVIITKPVMIRENFSKTEKTEKTDSSKSKNTEKKNE